MKQRKRYLPTDRVELYYEKLLLELDGTHMTAREAGALRAYRKDIRDLLINALEALTLFATKAEIKKFRDYPLLEDDFNKIFSEKKFREFLDSILIPETEKSAILAEIMAQALTHKLILQLPGDIRNSMGGNIKQIEVFAGMLVRQYQEHKAPKPRR